MRKSALLLASMALALVLVSGVAFAATKVGGPGDDDLLGTDKPDRIEGLGGDDVIFGRGGNDGWALLFGEDAPPEGSEGWLVGGEGDDTIHGGAGSDDIFGGRNHLLGGGEPGEKGEDTLYGGKGKDFITGDAGADIVVGGDGGDHLFDGEDEGGARDLLYGGSGGDIINSANPSRPQKDIVYCGDGSDIVGVDERDVFHDCEEVVRY